MNDQLSPREVQALALVAAGHDAKSAAKEMAISMHTVKDHLQFARLKLGARNSAHAVALAARAGVIQP